MSPVMNANKKTLADVNREHTNQLIAEIRAEAAAAKVDQEKQPLIDNKADEDVTAIGDYVGDAGSLWTQGNSWFDDEVNAGTSVLLAGGISGAVGFVSLILAGLWCYFLMPKHLESLKKSRCTVKIYKQLFDTDKAKMKEADNLLKKEEAKSKEADNLLKKLEAKSKEAGNLSKKEEAKLQQRKEALKKLEAKHREEADKFKAMEDYVKVFPRAEGDFNIAADRLKGNKEALKILATLHAFDVLDRKCKDGNSWSWYFLRFDVHFSFAVALFLTSFVALVNGAMMMFQDKKGVVLVLSIVRCVLAVLLALAVMGVLFGILLYFFADARTGRVNI